MSFIIAARVLAASLFALVTYLTLTPNPETAKQGMDVTRWLAEMIFGDADLGDKVAHFAAYGALGFSALVAQVKFFGRRIYAAIILALYGAFLEILQGIGGVRTADFVDAFANGLGVMCAWPAAVVVQEIFAKRRELA